MILHLTIKPGRKFDSIEKKGDGWQISIKAKPQDNEANKYLQRFLSEILKLPLSAIRIRRGHASRIKQIEILADDKIVIELLNTISRR